MSVLIIFIKLIAVFDLLVIAVYFGGDILSTMLNKLRRKPNPCVGVCHREMERWLKERKRKK